MEGLLAEGILSHRMVDMKKKGLSRICFDLWYSLCGASQGVQW